MLSFIALIICAGFTYTDYSKSKNKIKAILITDYRDTYVGTYFCNRGTKVMTGIAERTYRTDTISLYISKDATDSILQVKISNQIIKVKLVVKNMTFYSSSNGIGGGGNFFSTDSLNFNYAVGRTTFSFCKGKKK